MSSFFLPLFIKSDTLLPVICPIRALYHSKLFCSKLLSIIFQSLFFIPKRKALPAIKFYFTGSAFRYSDFS